MKLKQFLLLFISSVFILLSPIRSISLVSTSSIEKCLNEDPSRNMTCSSKLLLSLTIQNAELQGSDYIETTLNQITDKDGNIQKLASPIKITFNKTSVKVIYPATYFQDFNYYPTEKVIPSSSTSCTDSITDFNTTCGWSYSNGEKVPYSQGFCCSCALITFSKSIIRGLNCDGFLDMASNAHCLTYDKLWYSAYKVDKYKIDYNIEINIIDIKENKTISTLDLSPRNTIDNDGSNNIIVKLIGDFLPNDLFPRDLSDKFLLIPSRPEDDVNVKLGTQRWMLVDKIKFSSDGNECDKIGVGYFAFQSQSEKCNVEVGSCLKNQIYHLLQSDLDKISTGKNPEYLLKNDKNYEYSFYKINSNSRTFSYNLKGNINTLITLEINTDVLKFITNVSSGKIVQIFINVFEAMSEDGYMEIGIKNTGYFIAQYIISYECNDNIISLSSDEISLNPDEVKYWNKSIYTKSKLGQDNKCVVILKNSLGNKIDLKLISFNTTNEIQFNNQNNSTSKNDDDSFIGNKADFICENVCSKFLDFNCYIKNSCWMIMAIKIVIIIAIILILVLFIKFSKKIFNCFKCIKKLFCCCFCNCKKKKHKKEKMKSTEGDCTDKE